MARIKYDTTNAQVVFRDASNREIIRCPRCAQTFGITLNEARKSAPVSTQWYQLAVHGHLPYRRHLERDQCQVHDTLGKPVDIQDLLASCRSPNSSKRTRETMSVPSAHFEPHLKTQKVHAHAMPYFDLLEFISECCESGDCASPMSDANARYDTGYFLDTVNSSTSTSELSSSSS